MKGSDVLLVLESRFNVLGVFVGAFPNCASAAARHQPSSVLICWDQHLSAKKALSLIDVGNSVWFLGFGVCSEHRSSVGDQVV